MDVLNTTRDVLYDATKGRRCGIAQFTLGILSIGCGVGIILGMGGIVFYPVWGGLVSFRHRFVPPIAVGSQNVPFLFGAILQR